MAPTAQINARIEPALKVAGDKALAAAGLSPTQAIRGLWELAASLTERPQEIRSALFPTQEAMRKRSEARANQEYVSERLAALERLDAEFRSTYARLGIAWEAPREELSLEELKWEAYDEKYGLLAEPYEEEQ